MKISINNKYKSLGVCEFELPNFTVLTGKNGSGKTHLLEAMSKNEYSNIEINGKIVNNIKFIGFNGLNPNIPEQCDPNTITNFIKNAWNQLQYGIKESYRYNSKLDNNTFINNYIRDINLIRYIKKTIKETSKSYLDLTEGDLTECFETSFMGNSDFLLAQFATIFKEYHMRMDENKYNRYKKSEGYDVNTKVLSDTEFIDKYGTPPWDFINNILTKMEVPYEVNNPMSLRREETYIFKLIDKKEKFEINAKDLSTGEKVLMSLALSIYNLKEEYIKMDLLLIDEPGASLHPSMSKIMIEVLNDEIVKKNKIPVVITTHSPTTIICTEGSSIFQKEKGKNVPKPISIQRAVEILSSKIPFLRVSNENRRQVMVESKNDVIFYELLYNILSRNEKGLTEPIFFPAGSIKGSNCQDVKRLVKGLSEAGNKDIYGIIDWDNKNTSKNRVLVLGENSRYAIENYILDPLYMGLFLIRENFLKIDYFDNLSFSTYSEVCNLKQEDAQKIIKKILTDLNMNSETSKKYTLNNGWKLNISDKFCKCQGHELENNYKNIYKGLQKYRHEKDLKENVINKVINDYPNLAPKDLFDIIRSIK